MNKIKLGVKIKRESFIAGRGVSVIKRRIIGRISSVYLVQLSYRYTQGNPVRSRAQPVCSSSPLQAFYSTFFFGIRFKLYVRRNYPNFYLVSLSLLSRLCSATCIWLWVRYTNSRGRWFFSLFYIFNDLFFFFSTTICRGVTFHAPKSRFFFFLFLLFF